MCGLNTATMMQLIQGKWPELWTLNLSANSSLDVVAMSLLSIADWPQIHNIQMRCMKLSADVVSRLLHAQWTHGCCSDLSWTGLDAAAVLQLGNFT